MRYLNNNKGIALITVLLMSVIALTLTAALLNFLFMGTSKSGAMKHYETASEAADAALDISAQLVSNRGNLSMNNLALSVNNAITANFANVCNCNDPTLATDNVPNTCLCNKICDSKSNWTANCGANQTSLTIDPTNSTTYDTSFVLGSYTAYFKIVDTVQGNSHSSSVNLSGTGTVSSNSGMVNAESNPFIYRIEVVAQNTNNPSDRSKMTMLYAY